MGWSQFYPETSGPRSGISDVQELNIFNTPSLALFGKEWSITMSECREYLRKRFRGLFVCLLARSLADLPSITLVFVGCVLPCFDITMHRRKRRSKNIHPTENLSYSVLGRPTYMALYTSTGTTIYGHTDYIRPYHTATRTPTQGS